jgi:hypothetical protein
MRRSAGLWLATLTSLWAGPALAQAADCGTLNLVEQAAQPLPPTLGISGSVVGSAGSLLFWTADRQVIRVSSDHAVATIPLPPDIEVSGVAPVPASQDLLVLDAIGGVELRVDSAGRVRDRRTVARFPGEIVDEAVRIGDHWVTAGRDLPGRREVVRRLDDDGTASVLLLTGPADSAIRITRFHLTPAGDAVLLAGVMAPFEVLELPLAGGPALAYQPVLDQDQAGLIPADHRARWRSLPVVPLDCGAVQTLTDLTSEARLLVRYDGAGRIARVLPIDSPVGLVLSRPAERELVAMRRAGGLEVVFYQWRWVRGEAPLDPSSPSAQESR